MLYCTKKHSLLLCFLFSFVSIVSAQQIEERLANLPIVTNTEKIECNHCDEKYIVKVTQPIDHAKPMMGNFLQRVIVSHVGYDRPTIMITEGYNADYALRPNYQEELSQLLNANIVFVEHRYFSESTPEACNWDYLTAENSAYDLHRINEAFKELYKGKWISSGISKGGQTTCLYRTYFPDDVDFSVPYVAPLNFNKEDGRHESFLEEVGTEEERNKIKEYQIEVLKRKDEIIPLLAQYCIDNKLQHRLSMPELLDYCILEYPFALWQWGEDIAMMPTKEADAETLFKHLIKISGPEYFAEDQPNNAFFVQAARELGYYGYDTKPLQDFLTIDSTHGYLDKIMLPKELIDKVEYRPELAQRVYNFLKDNDPKIIFIYGENDPWSASRVPIFEGKENEQVYIQPGGSHKARIGTMPEEMREQIMSQIYKWLSE